MKNRILIILTFALTFIFNNVKAQVVFLHTHFDPPLTLLRPNNLPVLDTLKMDFNRDGVADLGISWSGWPWNADFIPLNPNWDWTIHRVGESSPLSSSNSLWLHENGYISDSDEYEWGVRLKRGNDYYYGWAYTDAFSEPNPGMPFNKIYIALHDMVFCTIGDKLVWIGGWEKARKLHSLPFTPTQPQAQSPSQASTSSRPKSSTP